MQREAMQYLKLVLTGDAVSGSDAVRAARCVAHWHAVSLHPPPFLGSTSPPTRNGACWRRCCLRFEGLPRQHYTAQPPTPLLLLMTAQMMIWLTAAADCDNCFVACTMVLETLRLH